MAKLRPKDLIQILTWHFEKFEVEVYSSFGFRRWANPKTYQYYILFIHYTNIQTLTTIAHVVFRFKVLAYIVVEQKLLVY